MEAAYIDPDTSTVSEKDYYTFEIPKYKTVRGKRIQKGVRQITAPKKYLKSLQQTIVRDLLVYGVGAHENAHAYRFKRSIKTMADKHVGKKYVLRIDLKDFFPSITPKMVLDALPKSIPKNLRDRISRWCFLDGGLPQGAPSSPVLSNIAFYQLDSRISGLANHWRSFKRPNKVSPKKIRFEDITYTRYSDDLVFSSNYQYLFEIVHVLTKLFKDSTLKINPKKTRFAKFSGRQYVTGIVVNEKLSISRDHRKLLRAEMHSLIMNVANGVCPANTKIVDGAPVAINPNNPEDPLCSLRSRVSHIASVCKEQAVPFLKQLRVLEEVNCVRAENWSEETVKYVNRGTDG